jgi:acyl-coenzyme A synthetase/AMP-(fatty) acid ligase
VTEPRLVICDERNAAELTAAGRSDDVLIVPGPELTDGDAVAAAPLAAGEPCLITFTSGTAGEPKAVVHAQRYLAGQRLQAEHWLGAQPGRLTWCTAASGWSKSARNVFIAPWLRGSAALLQDARFDPHERLEVIERERVDVLCMAPTEYRVIAKRAELRPLPSLTGLVAAGEALNPEVLDAWHAATGLWIRDGYGQTETGQLTGMPLGQPARPGSMGLPLPGVRLDVVDGELVADAATVPTFFLGYLGEGAPEGTWRTGDRVRRDEDGYLHFEGRTDDVIISAGYRIGPFEVESALVAHPAVAEAAVVAAPDDERGSVVRAVVVLRDGHAPSSALTRELQEHVKERTAPYKYPRVVDYAAELPKTASGKVRRAALRVGSHP